MNKHLLNRVLLRIGVIEVTTGVVSEILTLGGSTIPSAALAVSGGILITVALQQ